MGEAISHVDCQSQVWDGGHQFRIRFLRLGKRLTHNLKELVKAQLKPSIVPHVVDRLTRREMLDLQAGVFASSNRLAVSRFIDTSSLLLNCLAKVGILD